jgi:uncharacterized protein YkwD
LTRICGGILENEEAIGVLPRIVPGLRDLDLGGMRKTLITLLTTIALLALPALGQAASTVTYKSSSETQVLSLINQIRAEHNLGKLAMNSQLRSAAKAHSTDMLTNGYFEHDGPGETWDARVARYLKSPLIGENIAWGQGSFGTPQGIVTQWMQSPPHRAIILTAGFKRIGISLATGTSTGTPGATMATADFAA